MLVSSMKPGSGGSEAGRRLGMFGEKQCRRHPQAPSPNFPTDWGVSKIARPTEPARSREIGRWHVAPDIPNLRPTWPSLRRLGMFGEKCFLKDSFAPSPNFPTVWGVSKITWPTSPPRSREIGRWNAGCDPSARRPIFPTYAGAAQPLASRIAGCIQTVASRELRPGFIGFFAM